ncbi:MULTISPECIES: YegS/Rv2252/BmrU family lipid kinase [unclassified Enterococcus]|uniref:diacylglycerol/lipid kinase family protein n=1 Tax=unclassified Enterococcus TaxID=2608891 RepID=UPI0024762FDB|nr:MULTISPECIES: YegS/Rv2252/BmrU family lipid kinase [unclassified Enterococcus]
MNFHYHLLVNPASGSGTGEKAAKKIIALLDKNHCQYTLYLTEVAGDETKIASQLAEETLVPWQENTAADYEEKAYPLLVVLGGDGTLHEVLNCFYQLAVKFPIAYIPAGSGNDFARGVGLSKEPEQAFWHLFKTKEPRNLNVLAYQDAMQEESGLTFNNFGIGLDAAVVAAANQSATKKHLNKFKLGSLSYMAQIFKILFTQKGFPILVDVNGQKVNFKKTFLCTTTNHPYFGGGIAIAPMADVNKETFELVVVERVALFKIFWLVILLLRKKHVNSKYYHHFSAKKMRIISTVPQYGQADGETIQPQPFDIQFTLAKQLFWF